MASLISLRPSKLRTQLYISRLIKSILSSSSSTPLVVMVKRKFLPYSCSLERHTPQLPSQRQNSWWVPRQRSPAPDFSGRRSISTGSQWLFSPLLHSSMPAFPRNSPVEAKQYLAAQITVMGNVQAHGLHRARHHLGSVIPIRILAEELIHLHQFPHILVGFGDLLHGVYLCWSFSTNSPSLSSVMGRSRMSSKSLVTSSTTWTAPLIDV